MNGRSLIIILLFIGFVSSTHAATTTLQVFEQPYAYIQHSASANKISIVNMQTQGVTTLQSTNPLSIFDVQVDKGGQHAYLSFVNVSGIQVERWNLNTLQREMITPFPLLSTETNYQVALANQDKSLIITSFSSSANGWFAHWYDTKTFQLQGMVALAGKGTAIHQVVSPNTEKVFVAIGNTPGALNEVNIPGVKVRSLNSVLGNLMDATPTNIGISSAHVQVNSQMQSANFFVVNPSMIVLPLPVSTPPTIHANPEGNRIMYLSQNQQFKGGFYENGQFKCSFNTNVTYEPHVALGKKGKGYTIVDHNGPTITSFLREIDTATCANTDIKITGNAFYGFGKNRISITPDQQFVAAIEGNKLHYWQLSGANTETIIDLGSPSVSVKTRMVRRIMP